MSEPKPTELSQEAKEPAPSAPEPAKLTEIPVDNDSSSDYVGKRVSKKFGKRNFFGEIKEKWFDEKDKNAPRWNVKYDDGDEEDFDEKELANALKRYEKSKRFDFKVFPRKPRAQSKKRREVVPPPPRTNKFPKRGEKTD